MSEYRQPGHLGTIQDFHGEDINVGCEDDRIILWWPESGYILDLPLDSAAKLAELLDRAAMPGQEEARAWPCCAHCTRRPCAGHPYACADGCNGAEGGHG